MRMNGETTLSTIPKPARMPRTERKVDNVQVDWDTLRQQVLASSARLTWMDDVPQEVLEETWARRAVQVAQALEQEDGGEQIKVVVVRLGREVYGLETDYVFDIRSVESITRVPRVPDWVAGVVNLRGRIVSVLDLQSFLGLPPTENEAELESVSRQLVVVGTPAMELALLVDEVLAVETFPVSRVQDATGTVRTVQTEFMRGILRRTEEDAQDGADKTLMVILDLPALLAEKRLIVHEDLI